MCIRDSDKSVKFSDYELKDASVEGAISAARSARYAVGYLLDDLENADSLDDVKTRITEWRDAPEPDLPASKLPPMSGAPRMTSVPHSGAKSVTPSPQSVVVPVEPTEAMLVSADNAIGRMVASDASQHDFHNAVWSAMLAAAPAPSSLAGGEKHYGDPCIRCGVGHDNVPPGPCQGDGITISRERARAVLDYLKNGRGPAGWPTQLWVEVQHFIANIEAALSPEAPARDLSLIHI